MRVRIRMVTPGERHHVALVDPLPAGLESVNPALAGSESVAQHPTRNAGHGHESWRDSEHWFIHQELRDDRTQAFASTLEAGEFEYAYIARATTPGSLPGGSTHEQRRCTIRKSSAADAPTT